MCIVVNSPQKVKNPTIQMLSSLYITHVSGQQLLIQEGTNVIQCEYKQRLNN